MMCLMVISRGALIDSRGASTLILSNTEEVGRGGSWRYCESCFCQHGCSSMDACELDKVQIQVEGVAVDVVNPRNSANALIGGTSVSDEPAKQSSLKISLR